jgi:hypothetical protein
MVVRKFGFGFLLHVYFNYAFSHSLRQIFTILMFACGKEAISFLRSSNSDTSQLLKEILLIQECKKSAKQSTAGIRWWSPTQLLACRRMF